MKTLRVGLVLAATLLCHAPGAASAQEAPVEPGDVPGVVRLHLETSTPGVELRVFDGWMPSGWRRGRRAVSRLVCAAPCDRVVDAREGARYFFGGSGLTRSTFFRLDDRSGPLAGRVDAGTTRAADDGSLATGLGGFGVVVGTWTMVWGFIAAGSGNPALRDDAARFKAAGAMVLGAGAAALIAGVVMLARGTTRYAFSLPAAR